MILDQSTAPAISPFRLPAFRWFFVGRFVSLLGSSMTPVALSFAVLDATGSVADMSFVLAANTIPLIVFTLVGGVVGDRFSRRQVLLISNLGAGVSQGLAATLLISGRYNLPALICLEAINGTLAAISTPALRGIVPDLVQRSSSQRANSALGSARNVTKLLGPTAGATLVVAAGGGWAIAIDAATYFAAAVCMAQLRVAGRVPGRRGSPLADIRDGWTAFRSRNWVWSIVATFGVTNIIQVGIWVILGPLIAEHTIGKTYWGLVLSIRAAGVLIMALVMYRATIRHLLPVGMLCIALTALPLIVLGLRGAVLWLAAAAFIAGLGTGVYTVAWETSLQEHIPKNMLSRVSSYDSLGSFIAVPVGQLSAAPLAAAFGATRVALVGGILYAVLTLLPFMSADLRRLRHNV